MKLTPRTTSFCGIAFSNILLAHQQKISLKLTVNYLNKKNKLSLCNRNVLQFTNTIRAPIYWLIKAKESPSVHHYLYVLHSCMDAPNKEFCNFIFCKDAKFRKHGPMHSPSVLDLLDELDSKYNRNLG
jgi:hypothetical protein